MATDSLQREIENLVAGGQEGDYWDFKRCYQANTAELLHDIICMSNNLADRNAYIIYGVVDKIGRVVGVERDPNRRNQQELVSQLKDKKFASGIRPSIELVPLHVEGHDVDVLIIKNSADTPYFLTQDYKDTKEKERTVLANYIYTRVRDTNTDINKSADINLVEHLWRKRFGIDKPIYERYRILLSNPGDWVVDWDNRNYAYNRYSPEFQMRCGKFGDASGSWEPCAAFFMDSSMLFTELKLFYHSTVIYETELSGFDGLRRFLPKASIGTGNGHSELLWYFYYDLSSTEGKLLRMFTNEELDYSSREYRCAQFLLFENKEGRECFDEYYARHKDDFPDSILEREFEHAFAAEQQEGHHRMLSVVHIARAYKVYQKWTDEGMNPIRMAHQTACE